MSGNWPSDRVTTTPGTGTLEAHWTFDESSGQIALDSSGHGLNGDYHNKPKRVAGPMGAAVKFDEKADYIDFGHPTALRLTSSVTISAWIKSTFYPFDDAAIVSSYNGVGFQLDTTIDRGPRTIGFKLGNPCGLLMARYGKTPLALNTWYYMAGVYNAEAKTMDVYVNGELDNGFLRGPVMGIQSPERVSTSAGEATLISSTSRARLTTCARSPHVRIESKADLPSWINGCLYAGAKIPSPCRVHVA
jgi:hypothetical protein